MVMQEMAIAQMDGPAAAEERTQIEEEASELACAEYLACLFLLLADDEQDNQRTPTRSLPPRFGFALLPPLVRPSA